MSGFEHPAFAPGVDQAITRRIRSDERMGYLQDDRVAVLPGTTITAIIHKPVIPVRVFLKLVASPFPWARWQIQLRSGSVPLHESPFGKVRAVIEQIIVAFKFEQRLGNGQLARFLHGVWHVIKLGRVIDGPEEAGQVVEKGVVPAADKGLNSLAIRRLDGNDLVEIYMRRKIAARKPDEFHERPLVAEHRHPDLGRCEFPEILVFDGIKVTQE